MVWPSNAIDGVNSDGFLALLGGYAAAGRNARITVQIPDDPLFPAVRAMSHITMESRVAGAKHLPHPAFTDAAVIS